MRSRISLVDAALPRLAQLPIACTSGFPVAADLPGLLQSKEEEQARSTSYYFCKPLTADTSKHSITKRQCKAILLHQLTKLCSLRRERCVCTPLIADTLEYLITCHISTNNIAVHSRTLNAQCSVLSACRLCSSAQCLHAASHALLAIAWFLLQLVLGRLLCCSDSYSSFSVLAALATGRVSFARANRR